MISGQFSIENPKIKSNFLFTLLIVYESHKGNLAFSLDALKMTP